MEDKRKKVKINVLHTVLSLELGGLESIVMEMCKHTDRGKYNLSVLCLQGYDPLYKDDLEKYSIPVYVISKSGKLDLSFFIKIARLMNRKGIDIVHAHSGCFFNAAVAKFFSRAKGFIYTAHGMPVETGCQAKIEDTVAAMISDRIIAVSDGILDYLTRAFFPQKKKTGLIINGVDTRKFKPFEDPEEKDKRKKAFGIPLSKVLIGSVGRLESVKNYQMLIRAFAQLSSICSAPLHLVFIGDGSQRKMLEGLASELGVLENISFLGVQYDLNDIIPMLDIFVLSSLTEGTSISLLEAQASGVPAVVTNVGGNSRIIKDGVNGYLCDSNDPGMMAKKIHEIIFNKHIFDTMKKNARNTVLDKYDLHFMIRSYERLYDQLMGAED